MLKIYENGKAQHPLQVQDKDWYIEHKYDGYDALKFEIPDTDDAYKHLAEEVRITDGKNLYVVKKIDEHGGYVNVECQLDLDDWRAGFWRSFRTTNSTLQQVLDKIKPSGWKTTGAGKVTKRDTIESSEGKGLENVTAEDVLKKTADVYEVVFNFDVPAKTISVILPTEFVSSGDYFTDELNLKSVGFVGNSTDFATRLYAYGKKDKDGNPITIASVNGGKEYIENHQYSERIISVGWSDERYTVPENLLAAAKKKLDGLSYPVRSYECDVVNFDQNMYMYKVVTLLDRKRKTRTEHRVISFKEYPDSHFDDVITLSAVPPKIESSMKTLKAEIRNSETKTQQISNDMVSEALYAITGKNGGSVKIDMVDGNPEAIRIIHGETDETVLDSSGIRRNSIPYLYAFLQGVVEIDVETGSGVIHLPEIFAGKEIGVMLSQGTIEAEKESHVLQAFENAWEHDSDAGEVTVMSECKMIDIENAEIVRPKRIELYYLITGR